ncbi:MAG: S8 family serine peptidase [Cocleimonas sp.]
MKTTALSILALAALPLLTACTEFDNETLAPTQDMTTELTKKPEVKRLRYFEEINFNDIPAKHQLTGKGVRVTIMGEAVDASHPDLTQRVVKQYNSFSEKNKVIAGTAKQPYGFDKMGLGDGHGTHIAGTIAAECDDIGIQGVACGATLDVYDIGAYDSSESFSIKGWGDTHEFERLIASFSKSLKDITRRGESKITTGSFNIESPLIRFKQGGPLQGLSITEIINHIENDVEDVDDFFKQSLFELENAADEKYLKDIYEKNGEDESIVMGTLLTKSKQWAELEDAIKDYQQSGGVYLVTESNNIFDRTSLLNAMPSISDKVDKDLWLSIVMVMPEKINEVSNEAELKEAMKGAYITPINSCGATAKDYCLVTPSYLVFSTMTEKLRESSELYTVQGRFHQSFDGHSMGAPMVAATLALMQEYNANKDFGYTMKDLVKILKDSANRSFPKYDPLKHGRGMLDVSAALEMMNQ